MRGVFQHFFFNSIGNIRIPKITFTPKSFFSDLEKATKRHVPFIQILYPFEIITDKFVNAQKMSLNWGIK